MAKPKLWLGLSTVGILVTTLLLAGRQLAEVNAGLINDVLGLSTQKIGTIDSAEVEGSAYKDANGSLSDKGWYHMVADAYDWCEQAVEQGSVLLKNEKVGDNPALPLQKDERKVSLIGQGSKNLFMRSGAGGAAPNPNLKVTLDKAFKNNGFSINTKLYKKYETLSLSSMTTPSTTVEHAVNDTFYSEDIKEEFKTRGDAAIITFVRIGTEDSDPGDKILDLNNNEKALLKLVKEQKDAGVFKKVIVLINSPMPMSVDWVDNEEYGIDACVYMGVPGYYGAGGIVHVLMGEKPHVQYDEAEKKMVPLTNPDGSVVMEVVNPSGHLPTTFAANASSSAAYQNFGTQSISVYKEGVYVGYKYYETRYEDAVLGQGNADGSKGTYNSADKNHWNYADEMGYPFGYGLSYVDFDQKITGFNYNAGDDAIEVTVEVKNKGNMNGKASVQVYAQQPYTQFDKDNELGRPSIALMGYDKIDVPAGATRSTTVKFDRYFLATYDYKVNKTYVLEKGDYYIAVGNGAHEALNNVISVVHPDKAGSLVDHLGNVYTGKADCVRKYTVAEDDAVTYKASHYDPENPAANVTNRFDDADYNYLAKKNNKATIDYLSRQDWEGTWPTKTTTSPASNSDKNMSLYYVKPTADEPKYKDLDGVEYNVPYKDDSGNEYLITFNDMAKVPLEGEITEGKFAGKKGEDIWDAFIKQMTLDDLVISISDNRGILDVKKVQKKGNSVAEGPEGLLSRYQYGDKRWATGFPTGPTYTGTWDHAMQAKFGEFYGEDALFCGVASVNASGANIIRTAYTSRASEYMSEDGILNYNTAGNIIGAARKKGLIMNIKHCFLNNQERGRKQIETYCNEQAIREIYLRPFEGALTKGHGMGIMTSYNRIGARYAACHEPLMQNVMRGEWKYRGFIIDDAYSDGNGNSSTYSNGPAMLYCGTDLFCLDGNRGSQIKSYITSNNDGKLLKSLQRANKYVMYGISRSWMGGVAAEDVGKVPWWKITVNALVISAGSITAVLFGMYVFTEIMSKRKKAAPAADVTEQEVTNMKKFLDSFKNKAIGYYLVAADVLLALILALIFFATYKSAMTYGAVTPEIIGMFLIAGAIVEAVVLVLPQYRFVHIVGIILLGVALFQEVYLIPNLIADEINNVHYQGGDLKTNVFYLVTIIIILALAVAAAFIGFYKKEEEADADMPIAKNDLAKIIKIGVCGVVVIAAVLTSSLIAADMIRKSNIAVPTEGFNPITPEVKKAAEEYDYSFNPSEITIKEKAAADYDFSSMSSKVTDKATREGHNMVYYFEGSYSEGWQGDYSATYGYLCLWEDGLYGGVLDGTSVRGYWFNSSIAEGKDGTVKDCLKMVSNQDHYQSIITEPATGFYSYQSYVYIGKNGGRSMILNGYEYYPEVAISLNTNNAELETTVDEDFDMSSWVPIRVLKNLSYSAIFKPVDVTWSVTNGKLTTKYVDDKKERGISSITANFEQAGEQTVTIKWSGFETSVKINVAEAPAEEAE